MAHETASSIGARLRRVRRQQQMSLADVEEQSEGAWKAVVVGAYERGDRAVTIARLAGLATFYGVPLADLLPGARLQDEREPSGAIVLDLTTLEAGAGETLAVVSRFAEQIQRTRGDHNGRVLSLRASDVEILALSTGTSAQALISELQEHGALFSTFDASREYDTE